MRYLLIVLFAALIVAAGCSKRTSTGVSVNSAFRPLIPPDTKALAAVDVDKFKASPFYQRHQNELNFPLLDAMSERVGLDPRRDLSYILIVWNGKEPVAMARGRFKPRDLEQKFASLGLQRSEYKDHLLFGDNRDALTFERRDIAVAGPAAMVRSEIDLEDSGNGGVPDELQQRLALIPRDDQIWAVSRGGLAFAEAPMRSDIESALSNITGYISGTTVGIGFDTGTHVQAEITCISDQGAQRVRDALRGGIGLARLTTKDNESELLQAYDAIQVSQDRETVRVKADLSADLTDKLLAYVPALRSRAGQVLRER